VAIIGTNCKHRRPGDSSAILDNDRVQQTDRYKRAVTDAAFIL